MSATEYARPHQLRISTAERTTLAGWVMRAVEEVSADLASGRAFYGEDDWREPMAGVTEELARLRSLLERLTN